MSELYPDEWEQLPPELKALLIAGQEKIKAQETMQARLRAAQNDPDISEEELNALKVKLGRQTVPEQPDVFGVGGESAETARMWRQTRSIIPISLAAAVSYTVLHGGGAFLLVLVSVLVGVILANRSAMQHRATLLVDGDTLQYCGTVMDWQDITEIQLLAFGRVRIFTGDQRLCTFSRSEQNVDRLIQYARQRGVAVTGED